MTLPAQTIQVDVKGAAPHADDPHHVTATLGGLPRKGDQLSVWDGNVEVYVEVEIVTWPAWRYAHDDDRMPELWLARPAEMSDEEWADVFAAIGEDRQP